MSIRPLHAGALSMRSTRENSIDQRRIHRHRLRCGCAPCPAPPSKRKSLTSSSPAIVPSMLAYLTCGAKRCVTVSATQRAPDVVNSSHDDQRRRPAAAAAPASRRSTTALFERALHRSGPSSTCRRQLFSSRQIRLHRETHVDADRAQRRTPAHAHARADVQAELVGEGIARVDEHRRAPVLVEVVLVLGAAPRRGTCRR